MKWSVSVIGINTDQWETDEAGSLLWPSWGKGVLGANVQAAAVKGIETILFEFQWSEWLVCALETEVQLCDTSNSRTTLSHI